MKFKTGQRVIYTELDHSKREAIIEQTHSSPDSYYNVYIKLLDVLTDIKKGNLVHIWVPSSSICIDKEYYRNKNIKDLLDEV